MASEKIQKFIDDVKALTVLELNELVKALEEEFACPLPLPLQSPPDRPPQPQETLPQPLSRRSSMSF